MIKRFIRMYYFIYIFYVCFVMADCASIEILKHRLNKIDNLYVHFVQKIINVDSNSIEECQGEIWIKRPNLFYWHVILPEENFLISDGITLWFYVPCIKQVTAYYVTNMSDNIFWMLIFNNKISWNDYDVYRKENHFFLKPIHDHLYMKECKIKITDHGIPERFSIIEFSGRCIDYYLSKQNNNEIDVSRFFFKIPEGIQLDDQRR